MPRVEIHLSGHGEERDDLRAIPESIFRIQETLATTTGTVFVILEHPDLPQAVAKTIETLIASGEKPSVAFSLQKFLTDPRVPAFMKSTFSKYVLESLLTFRTMTNRALELRALDVPYNQYRDPHTKQSRLQVLFEYRADQSIDLTAEKYLAYQAFSLEYLKAANFDAALAVFQLYTRKMAVETAAREALIAERVAAVASDPDTAAVFIRFGTHHSGLYPAVREQVAQYVKVQKRYFLEPDATQKKNRFDPETSAIRKLRFQGPDSLTELEWYQAMLGACILNVLKLLESLEPSELSNQEMIKLASELAQHFQSREDVEEFREKVAETEIITALTTFAPQVRVNY